MKFRPMTLAFAPLLLAGSLAYAASAPQAAISTIMLNDDAAAIFAPESSNCPDPQSSFQPVLAAVSEPICGLCSVPACQGASPTTYCGVRPNGTKMYCQQTQMCTGEGIGKYRCLCVVGGDIIP